MDEIEQKLFQSILFKYDVTEEEVLAERPSKTGRLAKDEFCFRLHFSLSRTMVHIACLVKLKHDGSIRRSIKQHGLRLIAWQDK